MNREDVVRRLSALRKLSRGRGAFPAEVECAEGLVRARPRATERTEHVSHGAVAYLRKPLNFRSPITKLNQIFPCAGSAAG